MLTSRILPRLLQTAVRRSSSYHGDAHFKPPSMDELPVPRGSWQARHDAKQRGYNAILLFGIVFSVASVAIASGSGLLYLNYSPPKSID